MAGFLEDPVGYIWGGTTGLSYQDLKRRRDIAAALASRQRKFPQNVGEGLTYFGERLGEFMADRRLRAAEKDFGETEAGIVKGTPPADEMDTGRSTPSVPTSPPPLTPGPTEPTSQPIAAQPGVQARRPIQPSPRYAQDQSVRLSGGNDPSGLLSPQPIQQTPMPTIPPPTPTPLAGGADPLSGGTDLSGMLNPVPAEQQMPTIPPSAAGAQPNARDMVAAAMLPRSQMGPLQQMPPMQQAQAPMQAPPGNIRLAAAGPPGVTSDAPPPGALSMGAPAAAGAAGAMPDRSGIYDAAARQAVPAPPVAPPVAPPLPVRLAQNRVQTAPVTAGPTMPWLPSPGQGAPGQGMRPAPSGADDIIGPVPAPRELPRAPPKSAPSARELYLRNAATDRRVSPEVANQMKEQASQLQAARERQDAENQANFLVDKQGSLQQQAEHYKFLLGRPELRDKLLSGSIGREKTGAEIGKIGIETMDAADRLALSRRLGGQDPNKFFERLETDRTTAQGAARAMNDNQLILRAINDGVVTGWGANFRVDLERLKAFALKNQMSADMASNTELLRTASLNSISSAIRQLNPSGGPATNVDTMIARETAGMDPSLQAKTIERIIRRANALQSRQVNDFEEKRDFYLGGHRAEQSFGITAPDTVPPDFAERLLQNKGNAKMRSEIDRTFGDGTADLIIARDKRQRRRRGED